MAVVAFVIALIALGLGIYNFLSMPKRGTVRKEKEKK